MKESKRWEGTLFLGIFLWGGVNKNSGVHGTPLFAILM